MRRAAPGALALLLLLPAVLSGQRIARADSLFSAGDREGARAAYEAVLQQEPENTRALFQLARLLDRGSPRAVALLRSYVALEPQDAWGHWAMGEALAAAGEPGPAAEAFSRALDRQPGERDFAVARARALARAGRHEESAREYRRWLERQPEDAEALREQAEQLRRLRRPGAAAAALERSLALEADPVAERRLEALRMELAPAVEPGLRASRDSDGNTVLWTRLEADSRVAEGVRVGIAGGRVRSADDFVASTAWEGALTLDWTPAPGAGVDVQAGAARLAGNEVTGGSGTTPLLRLRARWRPAAGPAAELRLRHEPVSATPLLLGTPVVLGEARGTVDVPLLGPLYARGTARAGRLAVQETSNQRFGYGGGGVLRLGGATEFGASYQRTQYAEDSDAGYFSPERIDAVELAGYTEHYGLWPLVVALDAGVGGERITDWGAARGEWERAFRVWSLLSWSVRPGRELRLEAEAYETRAGAALAPTAEGWRWGSLALSFRAAVR